MALIATTRRFSFRSVHSLNNGVHREKIHGHQYFLEVSSYACLHEEVAAVVESKILPQLDGHDLTPLLPSATGEIIVEWIHARLLEEGLGTKVLGVALQETRKNRFVSSRSNVHLI